MQLFDTFIIPEEHIVCKTNLSFVFVNLRPFLKNHLLVSPKRVVSSILDLTQEEATDLFKAVRLTTLSLSHCYDGFTINIQEGKAAGQKVFHVHVHVVPRKDNDLQFNDQIYANGALDYQRTERCFVEMKNEADELRPYFVKNYVEIYGIKYTSC
ncbi:hypothetical protein BDAP_001459 [Binucleata daphniae]